MSKKIDLIGARKKCDKILSSIEKKIRKHYKRAEYELTKKWEEYLTEANKDIFDKWQAYQDALKTGDKDLIRKTGKAHQKAVKDKTVNNQHFREMVDEVTTQMAHVNETALSYINGEVPRLYQISYNAVGKATSDVVVGYSFSLMDAQTAKNLLTGNKDYMKYFKQMDIAKDKKWNKKLIHSQMTQGILQGESIPDLAKRLQNVTDMNKNQAVRNARTMTTSIENRGRMDGIEKVNSDGVVTHKEWIATGDRRTRPWHLELDGVTVPYNKKFQNEYGEIAFPGDSNAEPANIYNCRCALGGVVVGFKTASGKINYVSEDAERNRTKYEEAEKQEIKVNEATTRKEAYKVLNTMFGNISDNVKHLDEQLLCENVNQLQKLNSKFGVITKENKGYITASPSKKAIAYTSGTFAPNPKGELIENTNLGLVGKYYKNKKILIDEEKEAVKSFWSMPIKEENYAIYAITHEYGHMLENRILVSRTDYNAIKEKISIYNPSLQRKEYQRIEKQGAKEIYNEIVGIAKENNTSFSIKDNLSKYGHTNHFEFFAETFANSQLGKPNELGIAMQQWLKKEGY